MRKQGLLVFFWQEKEEEEKDYDDYDEQGQKTSGYNLFIFFNGNILLEIKIECFYGI